MTANRFPKLTLWRAITLAIFIAGAFATYLRFVQGLHASTNLSDRMPWGMWVGFGTLCGVGLSPGLRAIGSGVRAGYGALSADRADRGADRISRIRERDVRLHVRDRIALALLAHPYLLEPCIDALRRGHLRNDVHDRIDARVLSGTTSRRFHGRSRVSWCSTGIIG